MGKSILAIMILLVLAYPSICYGDRAEKKTKQVLSDFVKRRIAEQQLKKDSPNTYNQSFNEAATIIRHPPRPSAIKFPEAQDKLEASTIFNSLNISEKAKIKIAQKAVLNIKNTLNNFITLPQLPRCSKTNRRVADVLKKTVGSESIDYFFYDQDNPAQLELSKKAANTAVAYRGGAKISFLGESEDSRNFMALVTGVKCLPSRVFLDTSTGAPLLVVEEENVLAR